MPSPGKISYPINGLDSPNVEIKLKDLFDPAVNKLFSPTENAASFLIFSKWIELWKRIYTRDNILNNPCVFIGGCADYMYTSGNHEQKQQYMREQTAKLLDGIPDDKLYLFHFIQLYDFGSVSFRLVGKYPYSVATGTYRLRFNCEDYVSETIRWGVGQTNKLTEYLNQLEQKWLPHISQHGNVPYGYDSWKNPVNIWTIQHAYMNGRAFLGGTHSLSVHGLLAYRQSGTNITITTSDDHLLYGHFDGRCVILAGRNNRGPLYALLQYSARPGDFLEWPFKQANEHNPKLFGVELECSGDYEIRELIDACEDPFFIAKSDGSITGTKRHKYELVTVPSSIKALKRAYAYWFSKLDYTRFDCSTKTNNGMHVHIAKDNFDNDQHIQRFCWFFHSPSNMKLIVALSERGSLSKMMGYTPIYQFSPGTKRIEAFKRITKTLSGHRGATNLGSGKPTVEVRIFRGIVSYASILKNLEAVDSILEFTRETNFMDLNSGAYLAWLNKQPINRYTVLRKFCEEHLDREELKIHSELYDVIFSETDPDIIVSKLQKSKLVITNAHVTYLNRGKKRTYVLNKETNQLEAFVTNKGKMAPFDRELEKRYLQSFVSAA